MLCGHHETMHSAESRNQFSWNINTRALPQGSQHPKPALTQHKDSPCGYPPGRPSCSHWIESFWAHPAAYWPELSHPWGKTGTVQTQLPLWVRKEEIIKSWASLFMSEILKAPQSVTEWWAMYTNEITGAQINYSNSIPEGQHCHSVQPLCKCWLIQLSNDKEKSHKWSTWKFILRNIYQRTVLQIYFKIFSYLSETDSVALQSREQQSREQQGWRLHQVLYHALKVKSCCLNASSH